MPFQVITCRPGIITYSVIGLLACLLSTVSCQLHEVNENPNHTAYADSLIDHANDLLNDQPQRSILYLDSAYRAFPAPGPVDLWKKYRQKNNYYLNYEFSTTKARFYADSMALVLQGKNSSPEEKYAHAWTFFAQGDVLLAEKKYTEAFKRYYEGRTFARNNLDSCNFCQFSSQLGLVRYKQGQFLKAVPYLKQALAENSHCKAGSDFFNSFFFPQASINTIALCFERSGMPDSAAYYYQQALVFIDRQEKNFPGKKLFAATAKGVVYGNMGGVYAGMKKGKEAEKYLKESIRINDRPGYAIDDAQTAKIKLADLYIRSDRFPEADRLLGELENAIRLRPRQQQRNEDIRIKWYQLKWKFFDQTAQVNAAYAYLQRYYTLRDSVSEANKGLDDTDMDAAFRTSEQQYSLALLSRDNQIKKISLRAIIMLSLMTAGILLFIWYHLKRSRKHVAELTQLNQQVGEQNVQMQRALSALEQSQEENTRMMKIVAHDLRNPIGGITSVAALMLDEPGRSADDILMLELIKTSGQNSLELVSDLLQVHTRAEELKKEPVDLHQMLHYCVDLLHFKAEAKGQQIILEAAQITLAVNREKLWRVVSNLIANAIKFSPSGGVIGVGLVQFNKNVIISVDDHGIGIPEEMRDHIFDMFTEARRPGTAGEQSFGLGLAISKQIVGAHGGRIWFDSKPGKGATFFVELPIMD